MQKIVILGDIQIPHQDQHTLDVVARFIEDFQPDHLVLNGDILDAESLSHYVVDPLRRTKLADDVLEVQSYLRELEQLVIGLNLDTKLYFNAGNHEDRVRKYLWAKSPELNGLQPLDIPALLGLDPLWQYTPYYDPMETTGRIGTEINGILIIHGWVAKKWSAHTAKAAWEQFGGSGVIGHTHRLGQFYHRDYRDIDLWLEGGCLCKINPFYTVLPDWQQGFVAGYTEGLKDGEKISRYDLRCVPIVNHKFIWEGKEYGER